MLAHEVIYDWNEVKHKGPVFAKPIELCDETLRDGLQSPSVIDPPIATQLAKHVRDNKLKIKVNCAARTVVSDIEPIARIQNEVGIPIVAYCFLGTSPIRQYVEDWDFDMLLKTSHEAISFAIQEGLEVSFVTEDTTRSNPETLEKLFRHVISLGCKRLVLCDTVGHATPDGVRNLVEWTKALTKSTGEDVKLDWHGHNDRGLGVVNAIFAAEYGCDRVHGTCLGIGERVGNASIDQLIVNFKLLGQYHHDVSHLVEYVKLTSQACGVELPRNYPLSGSDAFRTATGVHAAAVIKAEKKGEHLLADMIYSSVPAQWFGRSQEIEIGPMSGLSNVRYWLAKRGIEASDQVVQRVFDKAKASNHVLGELEIRSVLTER
jgi:2-isopropylmalate synthase